MDGVGGGLGGVCGSIGLGGGGADRVGLGLCAGFGCTVGRQMLACVTLQGGRSGLGLVDVVQSRSRKVMSRPVWSNYVVDVVQSS